MIIYQIYPRSYQDTNGDGIGDLPGITRRLPHIASLGSIDYVWISPFFKSPMKDFGYDVADYRTVDPIFGSNEDFDHLLEEASRLGLKIMVDLVLAHTSNEHAWFQESRSDRTNPKADWYVWVDPKPDGTPPNNWLSVFGGPAWQWDSRRQQYYLKHFLSEQPALNWYNPEVEQEMLDTVQYWLDKGVRGFRLDAVMFAHHDPLLRDNPPRVGALEDRHPDSFGYQEHKYNLGQDASLDAMRKIRKVVDKCPDAILLGEISTRSIARRYTGDDLLHTTYFFDFLDLKSFDAASIQAVLEEIFVDFPEYNFFWSLSNHDFARHVSRFDHDPRYNDQFAKLNAALFFTLPGGYCLYQGEELGLPTATLRFEDLVDPFDRFMWPHGQKRDSARTPIPWDSTAPHGGFSTADKTWLPVDATQRALSVEIQENDRNSVLNYFRDLIAWREKNIKGALNVTFLPLEEDLLGYQLKGHSSYVCLFNISATAKEITLPGTASEIVNEVSRGAEKIGSKVRLGPYGFVVLR